MLEHLLPLWQLPQKPPGDSASACSTWPQAIVMWCSQPLLVDDDKRHLYGIWPDLTIKNTGLWFFYAWWRLIHDGWSLWGHYSMQSLRWSSSSVGILLHQQVEGNDSEELNTEAFFDGKWVGQPGQVLHGLVANQRAQGRTKLGATDEGGGGDSWHSRHGVICTWHHVVYRKPEYYTVKWCKL